MKDSEIKSLSINTCPHCNKEIIVESVSSAPTIIGIYTEEMIEAAKQEAIKKIEGLEGNFQSTIDWIKGPSNIFSPKDIDEIINNLQNDSPETPTTE